MADPAAPSTLLEADGELSAQRDAPVGGQAVIEGVMMRGVANWAVAVRKPTAEQLHDGERSPEDGANGEIQVTTYPLDSALRRHRVLRLPIVRGVVALGGSMVIGFRALEIAANAQLPPEEHEGEGGNDDVDGGPSEAQEIPRVVWAGTIVFAVVLAIGLFFLMPVGLTSLIKGQLGDSSVLFWVVEGLIRTGLFLGYLYAALTRARPAPRVRVPRRRAQDDLLLRGRSAADAAPTPSASRACTRAAARASCSW